MNKVEAEDHQAFKAASSIKEWLSIEDSVRIGGLGQGLTCGCCCWSAGCLFVQITVQLIAFFVNGRWNDVHFPYDCLLGSSRVPHLSSSPLRSVSILYESLASTTDDVHLFSYPNLMSNGCLLVACDHFRLMSQVNASNATMKRKKKTQ